MSTEDRITVSLLAEKAQRCADRQMITSSRFLDMHERSIAMSMRLPDGVTRIFYGGTEGAERTVAVFFPDYAAVSDIESAKEYFTNNPDDCPVKILKITKDRFSGALTHRDYLGSVMGLGIERNTTGDIIVNDNGCLIAVIESMAVYLSENLTKAGRGNLKSEIVYPWETGCAVNKDGVPSSFTVSSVRLDSIVKNGFGVSRTDASSMIEHGLVFVNDSECLKPDRKITEGDKITLRHKGRMIIKDCGSVSKKGRVIVNVLLFR